MGRRITLRSPLGPVALATRLKERVPATVDDATVAQVIGRGSEQDMTLWYYRPRFRNDLATRLVATIEPDGSGSVIRGRIGPATPGLVFLGCWFGFLATFLLGALVLGAMPGIPHQAISLLLGIPLAMMAFGALFTWLALRHGRRDRAAILAFLAETVAAR